mmetsp:Transcript_3891/g.4489  ORF Transcript_3891/g.4489 Transcript_3891/m.4489 type:complete len:317 (+) Transcript_3891:101-1051(+)
MSEYRLTTVTTTERSLTPQVLESGLQESLLAKMNESLEASTAILIRSYEAAEETEKNLVEQKEKICCITSNMKNVEANLDSSSAKLDKLKPKFGFIGWTRKHKTSFESKYGRKADWSGYLSFKKNKYGKWKHYFFVLLDKTLYYFKNSGNIRKELGSFSLEEASLHSKPQENKFSILASHSTSKAVYFRTKKKNVYLGWLDVLTPLCTTHVENAKMSGRLQTERKSHNVNTSAHAMKKKDLCGKQDDHSKQASESEKALEEKIDQLGSALDSLLELSNDLNLQIKDQTTGLTALEDATATVSLKQGQVTSKVKKML